MTVNILQGNCLETLKNLPLKAWQGISAIRVTQATNLMP